jgi:transketolase
MGGSADLAPSNMTWLRGTVTGPGGMGARNLHFGVREHAMAAVSNGIALHGGFVSYCGTFLVFSDYMRGAMRLSAMMGARVIYVLTHDSVAVGEDGPTHQPIEQIASLRAMPDMVVIRPADARETVAAWGVALEREGPTVLVLSRQNLPLLSGSVPDGVSRGAYIVSEAAAGHAMDMILIATGSEVHPALAAQQILRDEGINARVVSMPSWELFAAQPAEWREHVLPSGVKNRLAIEAASSFGWGRWTGDESAVVGINHYGASAPGDRLLTEFGFTAERIAWRALSLFSHRNAV